MKKLVLWILILCFSIVPLFSEEITGLVEEFNKIEEYIRNKTVSNETKKATLEKNLLLALKMSFHRKYLEYEEKIKDLNSANIQYQIQKNTNNVYVKYKEYYAYYEYSSDPKIYLQFPISEIFYIKPVGMGDSTTSNQSSTSTTTTQQTK